MKRIFYITTLIVVIALICGCGNSPEKQFEKYKKLDWKLSFSDDFTKENDNCWHLDGERGTLTHSEHGATLTAGNRTHCDSDHVVLWTLQKFSGDIKIEYDYTRLDTSKVESVNIIYIHAQGSDKGPYKQDIMKWCDLRRVPAMKTYFNNMNLYHISYAATIDDPLHYDYVRGRRYMPNAGNGLNDTDLKPEYFDTGLFLPAKTYHITVILKSGMLFMEVSSAAERKLFHFDTTTAPCIDGGNIGLRQMWARSARYANFTVCEL